MTRSAPQYLRRCTIGPCEPFPALAHFESPLFRLLHWYLIFEKNFSAKHGRKNRRKLPRNMSIKEENSQEGHLGVSDGGRFLCMANFFIYSFTSSVRGSPPLARGGVTTTASQRVGHSHSVTMLPLGRGLTWSMRTSTDEYERLRMNPSLE